MKKMNAKGLIVAAVVASLAACMALGCAGDPQLESGQEAQEQEDGSRAVEEGDTAEQGDDVTWDMEAFPAHVKSSQDTDTLAGYHLALGENCVSCHPGDLAAEVKTAGIDGEPDLSSLYYTDTETCLSSGCHDSWDKLAEETSFLGEYNPHDSIHGTIQDCNECHKGHSSQVDICGQCHPNGGQAMRF